jgi:hypothetical protein
MFQTIADVMGNSNCSPSRIKRAPMPRLKQYEYMTHRISGKRPAFVAAAFLLIALTGMSFLTSCSTAPTTSAANGGFKFWVLRYKPPVDATSWVPDATLSADPEGAALNIAAAMQKGNMEEWLSNWEAAERPNLTPAQTEAMLSQWHSLKDSHVAILGRVVAEADVIVELSVTSSGDKTDKIQIPLRHANDRWWLTAMDSSSEYLHWENSPNKLIDYIDPDAFAKHLNTITGQKPKAKADASPAKNSAPLAGL